MTPRARALGALSATVITLAIGGCGSTERPAALRASSASSAGAGTRGAALQLVDLPAGLRPCSYSGDIEAFVRSVRPLSSSYADATAAMWAALRQAGAADAFAAFYGNDERACRRQIVPAQPGDFDTEAEHAADHPRMASSIVVRFASAQAAEAAFRSDALGQSRLEDHVAMKLTRGEPTRLGPNSVVVATQGATVQVREAAWQNRSFAVLFRSAGVGRPESETATTAMNLRMAR